MVKFTDLFDAHKPIIGMIHLGGNGHENKIKMALEDLAVYQECGVDGAIIEDYHGGINDVHSVFEQINKKNFDMSFGVNILSNPYLGFDVARKYGAKFVQFDSVQKRDLNVVNYDKLRSDFSDIAVFGGVGFKYITPSGNPLEIDLNDAVPRCEAIVTTGDGTGLETPIDKIKDYKNNLGDFPLIVGAGLNFDNVYDQLRISDGGIVGSYFKMGENTEYPVDKKRVEIFMSKVREVRK